MFDHYGKRSAAERWRDQLRGKRYGDKQVCNGAGSPPTAAQKIALRHAELEAQGQLSLVNEA